ncbi:MAG: hypothetical protein ACXVYY_01320 [Oryzihumus sp.]
MNEDYYYGTRWFDPAKAQLVRKDMAVQQYVTTASSPSATPGEMLFEAQRALAAAQAQVYQLQLKQERHAEQVERLVRERDEACLALRVQEQKNAILIGELQRLTQES